MVQYHAPAAIDVAPFAFIIPYYTANDDTCPFIVRTIESIIAQTDPLWRAIIVDDHSEGNKLSSFLKGAIYKSEDRVEIFRISENVGPGVCRNIAISRAAQLGCPVVLFNDADDLSHPDRLRMAREVFVSEPTVDLVYSGIKVIDAADHAIDISMVCAAVQEIFESHTNPVEGYGAWIRIATETGYTNLTSSTAVRTAIAQRCPFPAYRVSEDSHTWMRISASGAFFRFLRAIPSSYRISSVVGTHSSRDRLGAAKFNREKIRVDTEGFFAAMQLALARGDLEQEQMRPLTVAFLNRLALTMKRDGAHLFAQRLEEEAERVSAIGFSSLAEHSGSLIV